MLSAFMEVLSFCGKYLAIFAGICLLLTLYGVGRLLARIDPAQPDEHLRAAIYFCSVCAFSSIVALGVGLLFTYKRPIFGLLLTVGWFVALGWILPDR